MLKLETGAKPPLLADILQAAYGCTQSEYIVYTNADIAVQPSFYRFIYGELAM